MKKIISLSGIFTALVFSLSACEVHFGSESYDVKWWVIAIPTVIFCAIIFFIAGKVITNTEYICPDCGKTFYPKWWQAVFSAHMGNSRLFKCPHCGKKNFCRPSNRD